MRIVIGSYIISSDPNASTTAGVRLRLDPGPRPFSPTITGNEIRIDNLLVRIETASEAACRTAKYAVAAVLDNLVGNNINFYNTTGNLIYTILAAEWSEAHSEYFIDEQGPNALIGFSIVANRDAAAEPGQIGPTDWQLHQSENGLTGATATGTFGPSAGKTAWENANDWANLLISEPPTAIPPFYRNRLRSTFVTFDHVLPKGSNVTTEGSHRPVTVMISFREVYAGLPTIPSNITNVVVSTSMAHEQGRDIRSLNDAMGSALLTISGSFTILTEKRVGGQPMDRKEIMPLAKSVYETIEADFLRVHEGVVVELIPFGEAIINLGLDSGVVVFSRSFRTTRIVNWNERTTIENIERVTIDDDYVGKGYLHQGSGGPITTLQHSLTITALDSPVPYRAPNLGAGWVRISRGGDVDITSTLFGGQLMFTTIGSSTWRYVNREETGVSDLTTNGVKPNPSSMDAIRDGNLSR